MKKVAFEFKVISVIAVALLFIIAIAAMAYQTMTGIVHTIRGGVNPDLKLSVIKGVLSNISNAESSVKSYTYDGDVAYLEPFYDAATSIDSNVNRLEILCKSNESQLLLVDSLRSLIDQKFYVLNELILLREDDRITSVLEKVTLKLDSVNLKSPENKNSLISRLFRSKATEEPQEETKNVQDVQKEITVLKSLESKKTHQVAEKQLALTARDKTVMDKIRAVVIKLEVLELKTIEARNKEAGRLADKANSIIAGFCFLVSIALLVLVIYIVRYTRKGRAYGLALKKARTEAEGLAKTKESFLFNMSHELRTPMNTISGFTEQLLKSPLLPEHREQMNIIRKSSDHLISILNDILDYSQLNAGKMKLEVTGFSTSSLINDVAEMLHQKAASKDIELITQVDSTVPDVLIGDAVRLKQVLINLVGNSVKFTETGSVKINCLSIPQDEYSVRLQISITDTGIGIPADKITTIFNAFEQADARTFRKFGGTGLGLSITKKLLDIMGGSIQLASEENKGTVISIVIPLKVGTTEDLLKEKMYHINIEPIKDIRVLVADDEMYNRKLLTTILKKWGVEHAEAEHGKEVVEKLKESKFSLVLMDLHMPYMNGIEATQWMKQESNINRDTPVLALTAAVSPEVEKNCLRAGMIGVITKPFKEIDLYKKICSTLQKEVMMDITELEPEASETGMTANEYDLSEIITLSDGDPTFVEDMVHLFINSTQEGMVKIEEGIGNNDYNEISYYAHKIASPCKHLGAVRLNNLLNEMDNGARKKLPIQAIQSLKEQIDEEVEHVIKFLRSELKIKF